ncbi:hypothetical protein [Fuchsiella alkaliacetigena]|nr:hypothetical protein [Fuchsiella alkaliacetigena]MCK8826071.1 hypothetical protein [Fuchsiella alkaliacetigena]
MIDLEFNYLISKALEIAARFHRGDIRKGTDTSYSTSCGSNNDFTAKY